MKCCLVSKKTYSFRLEESVMQRFKQFVLGKYGRIYEALGCEVQNALVHWLGEQGLVAHTKTRINPGIPTAQAKIEKIIRWLRNQGYVNQFTMQSWTKACIHTVGSDKRTILKYLRLAKSLNRVKHYAGAVWEIV